MHIFHFKTDNFCYVTALAPLLNFRAPRKEQLERFSLKTPVFRLSLDQQKCKLLKITQIPYTSLQEDMKTVQDISLDY